MLLPPYELPWGHKYQKQGEIGFSKDQHVGAMLALLVFALPQNLFYILPPL